MFSTRVSENYSLGFRDVYVDLLRLFRLAHSLRLSNSQKHTFWIWHICTTYCFKAFIMCLQWGPLYRGRQHHKRTISHVHRVGMRVFPVPFFSFVGDVNKLDMASFICDMGLEQTVPVVIAGCRFHKLPTSNYEMMAFCKVTYRYHR